MAKGCVRIAVMAVVVLCFGRSLSSPDQAGSVRDKLVGAWRLFSLEDQGPNGKMIKLDRSGVLMYSRDGHMAVEIMAPAGAPAESGPVKYAEGGFEAYFGTYSVDEATHTVTHHVEGALVRSLIQKDLARVYRFSGQRLILKSARPDEHWTIVWEHY